MVKLIIIADDFTGALDTGIQFAKCGIQTQVFTEMPQKSESIEPSTEVLVIDSESRHMSARNSYEAVTDIMKWAEELDVEIILKKTDSALRGNIGSELQAVLDFDKENTIYFLPGYPEIDRVTVEGTHYISGSLLEDSVFGKDPFEPVKQSYIPNIIKEQSSVQVECLSQQQKIETVDLMDKKIVVCDVQKKDDIRNRLMELKQKKQLRLLAGCAAIAESLANIMDFHKENCMNYKKTNGLLISCGSLNEITAKQLDYAEKCGFIRRHFTIEQKFNTEYYNTDAGEKFLKEMVLLCKTEQKVMIDSFDQQEDINDYLSEYGISKAEVRNTIPYAHGKIVNCLAQEKVDTTILMTGGDTLMGYMKLIGSIQLKPVCEIEQGVVLSILDNNGFQQQVISKSGGFGTLDVFEKIAEKIIR